MIPYKAAFARVGMLLSTPVESARIPRTSLLWGGDSAKINHYRVELRVSEQQLVMMEMLLRRASPSCKSSFNPSALCGCKCYFPVEIRAHLVPGFAP